MIISALGFAARHGKWCLVLGLLAGFTLPGLALVLMPWLSWLIAGLLFLSAIRIGPSAALGGISDVKSTMQTVALYQLLAPLIALAVLSLFGVSATPWALALVLVLAAPPVTGSPNFTVLLEQEPAAAMRLLLMGTALFPFTAFPILWLSPAVGTIGGVIASAVTLVSVIFGTVSVAFIIRCTIWKEVRARQRSALDGMSAILLGVVVVALMSAIGPALKNAPLEFGLWVVFAFVVNFGAQALAAGFMPSGIDLKDRTGTALVAGNRNIALFLVALPEASMDAVLLFVGCYQLPMYLTPILMRKVIVPRQI